MFFNIIQAALVPNKSLEKNLEFGLDFVTGLDYN